MKKTAELTVFLETVNKYFRNLRNCVVSAFTDNNFSVLIMSFYMFFKKSSASSGHNLISG